MLILFYGRICRDAQLGPTFARAVGTTDADWASHLARVSDFWSSVILKTGRYKGNPFGRHQALGVLAPEHFARWLGLFEETASERFAPEIAAALTDRAHRIGESLKAGLFFRPGMLG